MGVDVRHKVLNFLDWACLARCACASIEWRDTAREYRHQETRPLVALTLSQLTTLLDRSDKHNEKLVRAITELAVVLPPPPPQYGTHYGRFHLAVVNKEMMARLAQLPRLVALHCAVSAIKSVCANAVVFPSRLVSLYLVVFVDMMDPSGPWQGATHVMRHVATEGNQLTKLAIVLHVPRLDLRFKYVDSRGCRNIPFRVVEPLLNCPLLKTLEWHNGSEGATTWSTRHIALLRSMPSITDLDVFKHNFHVGQLAAMFSLDDGGAFVSRLKRLDLHHVPAAAAIVPLFRRCTNLTSLRVTLGCPDVTYLTNFRHLTNLELACTRAVDVNDLATALATLESRALLAHLKISDATMTHVQIGVAVNNLIVLSHLELDRFVDLHSLAFIRMLPKSISTLTMVDCQGNAYSQAEVHDPLLEVHDLPALSSFTVTRSFHGVVFREHLESLKSRKVDLRLPMLTTAAFTPR